MPTNAQNISALKDLLEYKNFLRLELDTEILIVPFFKFYTHTNVRFINVSYH